MNLQGKYNKKNSSSKYKNKYRNIFTEEVVFVNKHSIKDDKLKFTNFLQRGLSSTRNQQIKKHIDNCIENPNIFDTLFEGRDISLQTSNDLKKMQRVEKILNLYPNVPKKNEIIYKCTLKNDLERGFQLIFTMNGNKKYIYLIDLYHLTIPSKLNRKKSNFNLLSEYSSKTKYKKDIKDILFQSKELIPQ